MKTKYRSPWQRDGAGNYVHTPSGAVIARRLNGITGKQWTLRGTSEWATTIGAVPPGESWYRLAVAKRAVEQAWTKFNQPK